MSKQALHHDANTGKPRGGRVIALATAISASIAACISGSDDDDDDVELRGCDGVEEYIDENGDMVICVYTQDAGGDGGGGDPCWEFPWLCYPGDDDGGGELGGDDGGEAGGGGDDSASSCTHAGDDCTTAQRCCDPNVCAYGGERDTTWCQAFDPNAWTGSCATPRVGAAVYRNGTVCRTINGDEFNATCLSVQQQSCVIGYNGDCGNGTYTIHIRDLVQAAPGTCKG